MPVRKKTQTATENQQGRSAALHPEHLLEGIARGERASSEGMVTAHAQAKKRLRRWLGSSG